jgi:DNA polymerase III subunit chi
MRVDFYILQGAQSRELTACRLCEKAWQQGLSVFIQTESATHAQQLDELLWTFRDGSFLPHALADAQAVSAPEPGIPHVTIGWNSEPQQVQQVLINLAPGVPSFYTRFERIAEIVNQDAAIKSAGRERFTFYREHNCELHHHEI